MLQQGGIYVNGSRVDRIETTLTPADISDDGIMLRCGKKKYHRLMFETG